MCTVYRTRAHIIMHLACNTHPCHAYIAYIPRTLELEQQIFFSELLGDGFLKKGKNYRFMCQLFDKTNKKLCYHYMKVNFFAPTLPTTHTQAPLTLKPEVKPNAWHEGVGGGGITSATPHTQEMIATTTTMVSNSPTARF